MTMQCAIRQSDGVTIIDLTGRLSLAEEMAFGPGSGVVLSETIRELAKKVLSWVIHAKRILSTAELQHAVAVEPGKPELNGKFIPNIEIIGSVCAGLVTIDTQSDVVRLVHYTTQEYFEQTQRDWFPHAQTDVTEIYVTYLSFMLLLSIPV